MVRYRTAATLAAFRQLQLEARLQRHVRAAAGGCNDPTRIELVHTLRSFEELLGRYHQSRARGWRGRR